MKKALNLAVLFVGNFTLGFIPYWLITPNINRGIKHLSANLVLARELLIKMPFIAETKIMKLALINMQMDYLISVLGLLPKNPHTKQQIHTKQQFRETYKGVPRGVSKYTSIFFLFIQ